MWAHEVRRCPKCSRAMTVVDGSERTMRDRVFFTLRCRTCGHVEMDWYERRNGNKR